MSLSRWFRDYLYIPLGGNQAGPWKTYRNLLVVFVLCGIWHGAAWTFVLWGLWHGAFLILERLINVERLRGIGVVYTLLVVMFGWVFFRADSMSDALVYISALLGLSGNGTMSVDMILALKPTALLALLAGGAFALTRAEWRKRGVLLLGRGTTRQLATHVCLAALLFVAVLSVASGSYNPFLYFRF